MTDVLVGEHIRLRPLRADDRSAFIRIYTSPALTRFLGVDRMDADAAASAFGAQLRGNPRRLSYAITAHDDETMHGIIGLLIEDYGSNAMITGLVILPGAPVSGHGSEAGRLLLAHAFGRLGLHRVWAGHRSDHTLMRDIMLVTGLEPEATLRELFRTRGQWHDVTTYAALAHRWRDVATPHELAIMDGELAPA
ncbi:MAG TPA: GNAT family protein [Kutzneria sp.]|nr:GNAT family protein [Kutzneria sp.]